MFWQDQMEQSFKTAFASGFRLIAYLRKFRDTNTPIKCKRRNQEDDSSLERFSGRSPERSHEKNSETCLPCKLSKKAW